MALGKGAYAMHHAQVGCANLVYIRETQNNTD